LLLPPQLYTETFSNPEVNSTTHIRLPSEDNHNSQYSTFYTVEFVQTCKKWNLKRDLQLVTEEQQILPLGSKADGSYSKKTPDLRAADIARSISSTACSSVRVSYNSMSTRLTQVN